MRVLTIVEFYGLLDLEAGDADEEVEAVHRDELSSGVGAPVHRGHWKLGSSAIW